MQQQEWELDLGKDFLSAEVREVRYTPLPTTVWFSQGWAGEDVRNYWRLLEAG